MDIKKRALEIQDEVVANRRWLHQHPELGFALDQTVAFVKEKLTEYGYTPAVCGDHGHRHRHGGRKARRQVHSDPGGHGRAAHEGGERASLCGRL